VSIYNLYCKRSKHVSLGLFRVGSPRAAEPREFSSLTIEYMIKEQPAKTVHSNGRIGNESMPTAHRDMTFWQVSQVRKNNVSESNP
jgi:hypothetical protein